jgi:hypothetical protein
MWSPTKLDFPFYNLFVIYCDFSSTEINKKEKDKNAFKTVYNQVREVKRTVSKVEGDGLSGFGVQKGKTDFRKS